MELNFLPGISLIKDHQKKTERANLIFAHIHPPSDGTERRKLLIIENFLAKFPRLWSDSGARDVITESSSSACTFVASQR
jgi:hypothetical protein